MAWINIHVPSNLSIRYQSSQKTFRSPGPDIARDLQLNWENLNVHKIDTRTPHNFYEFFPRVGKISAKLSLFCAYEYMLYLFTTFLK